MSENVIKLDHQRVVETVSEICNVYCLGLWRNSPTRTCTSIYIRNRIMAEPMFDKLSERDRRIYIKAYWFLFFCVAKCNIQSLIS